MLQFKTTLLLSWYEGVAEPHAIKDAMSFHFDPTKSWHCRAYALQGLELLLIEYEDQPACTVLKCLTCPQPLRSFGITGEHILLQPEWHYAWVSHQ